MTSASLTTLGPGARAIVSEVRATAARIDKLAALGIVPGVEILVQQKRPVYVLECGETVLALEIDLAAGILVSLV